MSAQDDAELGQLTRQLKEVREHHQRLRKELANLGAGLIQAGQALQNDPGLIQLGPGGFRIEQMPYVVQLQAESFNLNTLGERIGEFKRLDDAIPRLEETLAAKGGLV